MDLSHYRESQQEKDRTNDLMCLAPKQGRSALDIGARDGHFSRLLTERFNIVTALDLELPSIEHHNITCVSGDITCLEFSDNSYDFVLCAEVLEHIPTHLLMKSCSELSRVTSDKLLIGVPYKQDLRVGRTTCYTCGKNNPPWGHVNSFDKNILQDLFPKMDIENVSLVGKTKSSTNTLSAYLLDIAGNPYGTYLQDEPCIHCGRKLITPPKRNIFQKIITKLAYLILSIQKRFTKEHANWIHILFSKNQSYF